MRAEISVVLMGLCLACGGGGAGEVTGAATGDPPPGSTSADGANTGPVSGTSGEAPTGETGETGGATSGGEASSGGEVTSEPGTGGEESSTGAAGCPPLAPRGLWVWQPDQAKDPGNAALLLEFAAAHGVTHVYLESQSLLAEDPERLAAFIGEADEACVAVELLFGAADWALTDNHAEPLGIVDDALVFSEGLAVRPAGLHFDVEPHGLADWGANQAAYANQYLDLLEAMTADLLGSELALTVDIAFWYDGVLVDRDGEARPLSELVQDRVDRVVIMDYRDHAEPPDGIVDNAATELEYAAQIGREVRVGVETTCGLDPEKVTFCEEGAAAMEAAIDATVAAFAASPAWAGVAVHDHDAWLALID